MAEPARAYSGWKLAWMPDRLEDLRAGRLCAPAHLQLHLTARCNLRCRHCIYGGLIPRIKRPCGDQLDLTTVHGVISDFAQLGGRALELTGGGEPTLSPHFETAVDYALRRDLDVALITNGVLGLDAMQFLTGCAPRLAWIRVSLDAVTAEDYKLRKGGSHQNFDCCKMTIRALADTGANVGVSYLVDEDTTTEEIQEAVALSRRLGARSVRFAPIYRESLPTNVQGATAAQIAALALQDVFVVDMLPKRFEDMAHRFDHPDRECGYMYTSVVAAADGCVYPCCFLAYAQAESLADLRRESFAHWWNSERRAQQLARWSCAKRCAGTACWMREKNDVFHKLVRERPNDMWFI